MSIGVAFNRRGHGGGKVGNRIEPVYDWQWGFLGGSVVKNLPAMQELQELGVGPLGQEDSLSAELPGKPKQCIYLLYISYCS